jgi:gluconate 2-dehydrogenase gamma chain
LRPEKIGVFFFSANFVKDLEFPESGAVLVMAMRFSRRELLAGTALSLLGGWPTRAAVILDRLPWEPNAGNPPVPVGPGPWLFFTGAEGRAVEAVADRIIPTDPDTPGGRDAGCAVYIDRQMAGPYGRKEGLYNSPPFIIGTKQQGPQSAAGPAQKYREGLAALDRYCRSTYSGRAFADLDDGDKDKVLSGLENESVKLDGADGKAFFEQMINDVQEGFFADPIYGGNRDMVAWRMIGYPGARYNYLDWVERHNERFPLPPVSIAGRVDWTPKSR